MEKIENPPTTTDYVGCTDSVSKPPGTVNDDRLELRQTLINGTIAILVVDRTIQNKRLVAWQGLDLGGCLRYWALAQLLAAMAIKRTIGRY